MHRRGEKDLNDRQIGIKVSITPVNNPLTKGKTMNTYEQLFFDNKEELKETITTMVWKAIEDGNEDSLDAVKKTIDFDFTIDAYATFKPYGYELNSKAVFESIEEYNDADEDTGSAEYFEGSYEIVWDDDCSYGEIQYHKEDSTVSVTIHGLADNASDEAKEKHQEILLKDKENRSRAISEQEELIDSLAKQMYVIEANIKRMKQMNDEEA